MRKGRKATKNAATTNANLDARDEGKFCACKRKYGRYIEHSRVINSAVEVEIESQISRYDFNRAAVQHLYRHWPPSVFTGFMCARTLPMTHSPEVHLSAFSLNTSVFRNKGQRPAIAGAFRFREFITPSNFPPLDSARNRFLAEIY